MATELKTTLELDIKPFLDAIKRAASQLSTLEEFRPKFNTSEFNNLQRQISGFKPEINVSVNVDKRSLDAVETEIKTIGEEPVDIEVLVNSEEIQRAVNRTQELRSTALTIPPVTNLNIDANTEKIIKDFDLLESTARKLANAVSSDNYNINLNTDELREALNFAEEDLRQFGIELRNLPDFTPDVAGVERAKNLYSELRKTLTEVNRQQISQIFPGLEQENEKVFQSVLGYNDLNEIIDIIKRKGKDLGIDVKFDEQAVNEAVKLRDSLLAIPNSKTTKVDVTGDEKAISDLNKVQKETNDIPNQKNIKINIDRASLSGASNSLSSVGGFVGQLGSGLLASFSGAAIGAAVANFASQAVRAIVSASDAADELQDKLKLAFTQAGAEGFVLDENLQRANEFAFQLGDNFGISIRRSQELLAQVVGLTGEFGATSEAITKASLGIEEATGGLVKAETAAKLFSRSIGNPEDQAALETLAKRFPAIGQAIQEATDPAEKANAVLSNLTGTFTALEEKAQGFGENFQLLSEVAFATFATAVVPIADSLVPILERLTDLFLSNADTIEQFGQSIVNNFIDPLITQINQLGPSFENFFSNLGDTLSIIATTGFGNLTNNLELVAFGFSLIGDILKVINPILQTISSTLGQLLQPIIQTLSGDISDLNNPLAELTGGLLEFQDNAFSLAPILESLANIFELLQPLIVGVSNVIYISLLGALDALEIQLGLVLLPIRALNFAFDAGKGFIKEYGDSVRNFVNTLADYIPTVYLFVQGLQLISKLTSQPLGKIDIGTTTPIEKLDATLFDATDTAQKFNEQYGVKLPGAIKKYTSALGGAGGAGKGVNDAGKETLTILEQQLLAYDEITKVIESRYNVEIAKINVAEKQRAAALGRQLNDNEKLAFELQRINLLTKEQTELQKTLSTQFGISEGSIRGLAEEFLKTGNLSAIPINIGGQNIKFDPTDPKNKQSFQRVSELLVKSLNAEIQLESQKVSTTVNVAPNVVLDSAKINVDLDKFERDFQRQLNDLEFGRIAIADFDIDSVRNQLQTFRQLANVALVDLDTQLQSTQTQVDSTITKLDNLRAAGKGNSDEAATLVGELGTLQSKYSELEIQQEKYNGVVDRTTEKLDDLGNSIEQTISQRFRRLQETNEINVTFDLNSQGVNEQLIEIERGFQNSILAIEQFFATAFARVQAEGGQVGPSEVLKNYAEAQKNALRNIATQRQIAIREFNKQNNAIFAISESLRINLSGAITPDNTRAKKAFDERKQEINNELELLKTNLDLRTISYQDYNAKVIDLERQKADAIKEYDNEVEQNRLEGFQRIANDALPAINRQLEVASAELTVLLADNASEFVDVANKSLETIALVGAQSLGIALQQAQSLEEVQKLFIKALVRNVLQALQVQLVAAILQGIFRDVEKAGTLGLITGALIGGALTALFLKAEQEILKLAGYESGGYTGDGGTKDIAGVVHGQEYVINARGTRDNRQLLDWINKGNSADSFFDNKAGDIKVDNYVDTKAINQSINTLAYTMDSRLSSLETTVDTAIRQNATLTKSANQLDVSVYSDPGTAIKYMKKMGKIKGLS